MWKITLCYRNGHTADLPTRFPSLDAARAYSDKILLTDGLPLAAVEFFNIQKGEAIREPVQ